MTRMEMRVMIGTNQGFAERRNAPMRETAICVRSDELTADLRLTSLNALFLRVSN